MSPPQDRSVDRPVPTSREAETGLPAALATARTALEATGTALGYLSFWTAVCLPVLLVALVVAGIETAAQARAFLTVTAVECVALALGRTHLPE